ncbi:hypothetical protein TNIN_360601 [Trichonephila inaurata madagascariensis]|uniref:Uncharacterized protein n=1 Tax=Trichonephila inaurata madagascariensis TaxID=2747483 RepID=A0A8X6WNA2_9ARAC|nr:hypothetical protein TNIN_360601 [Trichonephila inaurata madagascariensis]
MLLYARVLPLISTFPCRYMSWLSLLRDPITNLTYEATPMNTSIELMESFAAESYIWKWKECCLAAVRCCNKMLSQPPLQTGTTFCS